MTTATRPTRPGPAIWPKLLRNVRRAIADGASTYAQVYAAVPTNNAAIRRAIAHLADEGVVLITAGRPTRLALAQSRERGEVTCPHCQTRIPLTA